MRWLALLPAVVLASAALADDKEGKPLSPAEAQLHPASRLAFVRRGRWSPYEPPC